MALEVNKKKIDCPWYGPIAIGLPALIGAHDKEGEAPPENEMVFTYKGWDKLVKDMNVTSPEDMLEKGSTDIEAGFNEMLTPHSPMTPEEGAKAAKDFEVVANASFAGLAAAVIGTEAAGMGQLETPAMILPKMPIFAAGLEAAQKIRMVHTEASIIQALKYQALATHQPTIIPPSYLLDAVSMGLISDILYKGQMLYHGYTIERSALMAATNIRIPDLAAILELRRRGLLSDAGATDWLVLSKVPRKTAEAAVQLYKQIPEPYRLVDMAVKGRISPDDFNLGMSWFGIDPTWASKWVQAQTPMLSPDITMTLLRRGIISKGDFVAYMRWNGYGMEQIGNYLQLRDVVPPISDLIRFAVREAFGDHNPDTQYQAMVAQAKKMGLTDEAASWYWYSHWERIPINLMFANYHRGLWNRTKLEQMLKIADIHPDDREDVINVAFNPPSIREQGYGYDVGVYTVDDIVKYRRWGGLSPEDALKAGKAMVAYRTEAERNSVRVEYMYAYGRNKITREAFEQSLKDIGTSPEAIPLWLQRGDLYKERITKEPAMPEQKIVSASEALTAFELGLRDEGWTRDRLKDLGWVQERIDVAIEKEKKVLAEKAKPPAEAAPRKLTITQLTRMFRLQKITKDAFIQELVDIGYTKDDAALLFDIYTYEEPTVVTPRLMTKGDVEEMYSYGVYNIADVHDHYLGLGYSEEDAIDLTLGTAVSVLLPYVRSWYSKGWIDADGVYNELVATGLSADKAEEIAMTIVKYEAPERTAPERDLTKAEIIKGVKNGVLTVAQGVELLMGLGYSQDEANYLLLINKVVVAGDPDSYFEMKQVVEAYKKSLGMKSMEVTPEMIELEKQIKATRAELDKQRKLGVSEDKIGELAVHLAGLESQLRTLVSRAQTK